MPLVITEKEKFDEIRNSKQPFVLSIGAEWCAPAKSVNELLDKSTTAPTIPKIYIDAEKLPEIAEQFEVDTVPTVLFFRSDSIIANEGKTGVVAQVDGFKPQLIEFNLRCLFGKRAKSDFKTLDEYLGYLVGLDRVVVFLTGSPSVPRCGFAGKLVDMLASVGLDQSGYTYVDILEDEEMCQGLKKYSDWPTYPQVYVSSELIGGMDICSQMHAKGQLGDALLPAASSSSQARAD